MTENTAFVPPVITEEEAWWTEQAEGLRGRLERGEPFKWFAPYVDGLPTV